MINWISSWAGNIVIVVIISTILEMILPEGNNKKYIKTIIGIFILFNIIGPVITKVTGESISFDSIAKSINIENISTKEEVALNTETSIKEVYLDNLKLDLERKISEKGYIAKDVFINVQMDDKENYGKISGISFKMRKKPTSEKREDKIQIVNEINVSISHTDNREIEQTPEEISSEEYKEIQKFIANSYGVDIQKVNIY